MVITGPAADKGPMREDFSNNPLTLVGIAANNISGAANAAEVRGIWVESEESSPAA
jgi:hypothetical protein